MFGEGKLTNGASLWAGAYLSAVLDTAPAPNRLGGLLIIAPWPYIAYCMKDPQKRFYPSPNGRS